MCMGTPCSQLKHVDELQVTELVRARQARGLLMTRRGAQEVEAVASRSGLSLGQLITFVDKVVASYSVKRMDPGADHCLHSTCLALAPTSDAAMCISLMMVCFLSL